MFPSRRLGLSLSPGPAGDVSHTCAEDAPVTGEEAAAGGGAGGGEGGTHFLLLAGSLAWDGPGALAPAPGTATLPLLALTTPPPPGHGRPPSPGAAGLFGPPGPLSSRPPPTSPGARLVSEMPLQQQVSDRDGSGGCGHRGGTGFCWGLKPWG